MKKFILFAIVILGITVASCTYRPVSNCDTIPQEVLIQLQDSTIQMDNVFIIKTEGYHYVFNESKILIDKYDANKVNLSIPWPIFILLLAAFIMIIIIIILE